MKMIIKRLYENSVIRYIFFGGLTTLVNLGTYWFLRAAFDMNLVIANIISVAAAILFAYFANSRFVFQSKTETLKEGFQEFVRFVTVRLSTMVIEVGGVWLLADVIRIDDMVAKVLIQFVVLALNYVFSKFLVFTKKRKNS